ncbi:hypothetical protein DMH88_13645 [Escherichia coli]|nr:hypothetical protein [Escherichia coli]
MDFMSILGRCCISWGAVYFFLFLIAMFVGCLFRAFDDRFTGMFMSFIVGCLSWYITASKPQRLLRSRKRPFYYTLRLIPRHSVQK